MLGLVIADDEQNIRQGLAGIPWHKYGIELKGTAENGVEALDIIRAANPQIIMVDIRMPGINGIDLIQAVKSENPDIKSIILTGYNDFDYAHSAIKLGVFGFILKPSNPGEIIDMVLGAKAAVQEAKKTRGALFEKYLFDLLNGNILYKHESNEFGINLFTYSILVLKIHCENSDCIYGENLHTVIHEVRSKIEEFLSTGHKAYTVVMNAVTLCVIVDFGTGVTCVKDRVLKLADTIREAVKNEYSMEASIGISRESCTLSHVSEVFNQAVYCMNHKVFLGHGSITYIDDVPPNRYETGLIAFKQINEIINSVKLGNYCRIEELIPEIIYSMLENRCCSDRMIKDVCIDMVIMSLNILVEKGLDSEGILYGRGDFLNCIESCSSIESLVKYISDLLADISDVLNEKDRVHTSITANDIFEYISTHYMEDITLQALSRYVHLNPVYLSRLIKKELGRNFVDVLNKVRMEKACELLGDINNRTYDICDKVGIRDSKYFSQVFKKYIGITPKEYRKRLISRYR